GYIITSRAGVSRRDRGPSRAHRPAAGCPWPVVGAFVIPGWHAATAATPVWAGGRGEASWLLFDEHLDWADFDGPAEVLVEFGGGVEGGDVDGLVEAVGFDDEERADLLLGLGEGAIGDGG